MKINATQSCKFIGICIILVQYFTTRISNNHPIQPTISVRLGRLQRMSPIHHIVKIVECINLVHAQPIAHQRRKMAGAHHMEQVHVLRYHVFDCASRQLLGNAGATVRPVHRHDFALERSLELRIVLEQIELGGHVLDHLENGVELLVPADVFRYSFFGLG